MAAEGSLKFRVAEALSRDAGRAFARLDPQHLEKLGASTGDTLEIMGRRSTVARAMRAHKDVRGRSIVQLDGVTRANAGVGLDDSVIVRKRVCAPAQQVAFSPTSATTSARDLRYLRVPLDGLPVTEGDEVRVSLFGHRTAAFRVRRTRPAGSVVIGSTTDLAVEGMAPEGEPERTLSYEDIGGLGPQVQRIREMIELPLRYPEVFARLGIDPPKGVLLHGPPGTGKTLIARTIAQETDARFFSISGPEVIHKFYGESEAHLRKIFDEASKRSPSIIFLDEIDAIAPSRERVTGEVEKRVVAQLLALMDGLNQRQNVIVIAATNIPNALDSALRRPGRFDREIAIPIPDRNGRREILEIHSLGMPLGTDVQLDRVADATHGFVGADLEALCREAAMICVRRLLPHIDFSERTISDDLLARLEVRWDDFAVALREVEPSAIREVFVEISDVRWSDVGGLDHVKKELVEAVEWPLKHPDLFEEAKVRPPKGVLLTGAPGCGKTLLAKAVATESGVNFIAVKGAALLSKYVGESEKAVREVFQKARQAAPCIVFFDEIDALVPGRTASGGDSHVGERVISQFLTEMDGIEELRGVLVLGATNRPDIIDKAVLRPGRFDAIISIPLPVEADRTQIFLVHLRDKPLGPNIDQDRLARELAVRSVGLSGADIALVCNRAALEAVRKAIDAAARGEAVQVRIEIEDLERILTEVSKVTRAESGPKATEPSA